ncbi:MAG: ATP-dependent DNA helicase RecG [Chloroflexi bacterium]|nr:ATP-dependent DNA helicase RecG [Chloroflexota bacterium]
MKRAAEQLAKILRLEQAKGCADTAVVGGLDRFLSGWAVDLKNVADSPNALERVDRMLSVSYATLDKPARLRWTAKAIALLESLNGGPLAEREARSAEQEVARHPQPSREKVGAGTVSAIAKAATLGSKSGQPVVEAVSPRPPIEAPISSVKGIHKSVSEKLHKLGVDTTRDLLYFFPRRHNDFSQVVPIARLQVGKEQTIVATVWEATVRQIGRRMRSTEAVVGDETGNTRVVWFNQPFVAKALRPNTRIAISGKVSLFKGMKVFESPEWEYVESGDTIHTGRLVPVYPLTEGLYPKVVRRLAKETVDLLAPTLPDFLPEDVRRRLGLMPLSVAIAQAHFPDNPARYDQARRRLAFDELFTMQLRLIQRKREWQDAEPGIALTDEAGLAKSFIASLPYPLTRAQKKVLREIIADLKRGRPMSRLLQGDVGSGKTVVATAAMLFAASSGYQAALMAPTEILAEQHFRTICSLLQAAQEEDESKRVLRAVAVPDARTVTVGLLIGGLKPGEKRRVHDCIAEGAVDLIIGTQALIQKAVSFDRLALAVVDEQHRFGVMQRSAMRQKGFNPHVLAMSATPIPRTLALTVYGDLDVSVIDELPPGRQEIVTKWVDPRQRPAAYDFVRKQVAAGRQAFVICPLIEESESIETRAAVAEYERLSQEVFPDLRLGLLHGRMSPREKDEVMRRFREGELHVLVSTAVVEVGIDVPNATVMLVEGAERFGLSQLHQFRGRVGRGEHKSYCLLLSEALSEDGEKRLAVLEKTSDGFKLAEADLEMRGPGEFLGTRQSGLPDLRMARLSDVKIIEQARQEAAALLDRDLHLDLPERQLLAREMARRWSGCAEEAS